MIAYTNNAGSFICKKPGYCVYEDYEAWNL